MEVDKREGKIYGKSLSNLPSGHDTHWGRGKIYKNFLSSLPWGLDTHRGV